MPGQAVYLTPQFINGPKKPGGKFGSIKTAEMGYVSVPVDQLHQFTKGHRVCVEVELVGEYKNFVRFANQTPAPAPQSTAGNFTGAPQQIARPVAQAAPQRPNRIYPIQAPFQSLEDPIALNIFCTGIVGRALGSGHFTAADIDDLMREAKAAFLKHLAPQRQTSAPEPEYNEPLPDPSQYGAQPPVDDWQQ